MAELTQEQFEQLPEFVRGDYEQSGEVYRPVAEGKLSVLKGKMNELDGRLKNVDKELGEYKSKAQLDRESAEQAALERLKKDGKVDEIVTDLTRRHGETVKQFEARIENLSNSIKAKERKLIVGEIASELKIFEESGKLFSRMVQDRIEIDPETGKVTFLDEDGGATSLDKAGFIAELAKDAAYDRIRQGSTAQGGKANGNNGTGGGAAKKFTDYNGAELKALRASKPAEYERLLNEHKGTEA